MLSCSRFVPVLAISALLTFGGADAAETPLSVLTFNLHGYHPMNEPERWLEDRSGTLSPANTDLFYFTNEEIARGQAARLDRFASDLTKLAPDLLLLQEVGAGAPWTARDCSDFNAPSSGDGIETNTAIRLQKRMEKSGVQFGLLLGCRGNRGWQTSSTTFADRRVVRLRGSKREVVYDFNSNPFPDGMIVEGTAILVGPRWKVVDHQQWNLETDRFGNRFFVQAAVIAEARGSAWFVVANVHAGHKVQHFEQAVALRSALLDYIDRIKRSGRFIGTIVAGDFNARLDEVSMLPWRVVGTGHLDEGVLTSQLDRLNRDRSYKDWASIRNPEEAVARIRDGVDGFFRLLRSGRFGWEPLSDAVVQASVSGRCRPIDGFDGTCHEESRIDFILSDGELTVRNAFRPYQSNSYRSTLGLSDHPAIFSEFSISD